MELRPYQEEARKKVQEQWEDGVQKTLLVVPTGCHEKGSKLLCYDGKIKKVEDITKNDLLMGPDGTPRKILMVHEGVKDLYKITPLKGESFVVTDDHLLTLIRTNEKARKQYPSDFLGGSLVDVQVKDYLNWTKNKKHIYKLVRSSKIKKFGCNSPLTIDPYFLGILLGDGELKNALSITTMDKEVVEEIDKQCLKYNMTYRTESAGKAITYIFKTNQLGMKGSVLHNQLKELELRGTNSRTKFVPHNYKTSSVDNRLEILAGLLDSDGSLHGNNGYDFISASEQLANDVAFIARSLGLACYVKKCKKKIKNIDFVGEYYRLSISGDTEIIPCRIPYKKSRRRRQKKDVLRTGFEVEYVGKGEYIGFTVDRDNRYLLDDFTVTHNCGKTIIFSKIAEDCVKKGEKVLILAHRGELLEQASDKIKKVTGLVCATEKAEQTCLDSWYRIVVGSVQTLQRETRLNKFTDDYFDTIIIDEAHHAISNGYQKVLEHFSSAKVLGVTATPDRGDMKNLGSVFESLAFEYTLPEAIKSGYLSPIRALTVPLKIDFSNVGVQSGDYKLGDIDTALDPYLNSIADEMVKHCINRKTVVFLPLIKTSQKFKDILNSKGFKAAEVNGNSDDRQEILEDFDKGKYNVLCNSMLLTEGWDCPSVDCVIVLRPTKVRALYSQMIGRGTRLYPGKDHLLILDFLWHTEKHALCHPANLICTDDKVAEQMTKDLEVAAMNPNAQAIDIEEAEKSATEEVVKKREEALAKQLETMKSRKSKLVDPIQYEMSIQSSELINYVPSFGYQSKALTEKQKNTLESAGINTDGMDRGKAELMISEINKRKAMGLATPKQIRMLERYHFNHVGHWTFEQASKMINRIAACGWRLPKGVNAKEFNPNLGVELNG